VCRRLSSRENLKHARPSAKVRAEDGSGRQLPLQPQVEASAHGRPIHLDRLIGGRSRRKVDPLSREDFQVTVAERFRRSSRASSSDGLWSFPEQDFIIL
jgi:hypothetical protein